MTLLTCPACGEHLALTRVIDADANPGPIPDAPSQRTYRVSSPHIFLPVKEFLDGRSGRFVASDLYAEYAAARMVSGREWPELTVKAFGRAMRALGAVSWRTRDERGWEF